VTGKFALRAHCRQDVCAPSWRVFCAIELPLRTRGLVLRHIARLQAAVPEARASWSREASLHLTLKFIGDTPQTSVPNFSNAAARAVEACAPFTIRLEQRGVFPNHGTPRVLWLGVNDPEGNLGALHGRLENASAKAGFPKEARPFHPHLTLARLRQPQHANALAVAHRQMQFGPVEITVSELLVIRSELSSAGSNYTIISQHPLDVK
jgi:RNA 2',3'-cyclic 3'-phosphodiesterase